MPDWLFSNIHQNQLLLNIYSLDQRSQVPQQATQKLLQVPMSIMWKKNSTTDPTKTFSHLKKIIKKKSCVSNTVLQPNKNTILPKSDYSPPTSISNKSTKVNKTSPHRFPFAKFKGSKQLQHFVAEAMEAEANDHDLTILILMVILCLR